MASRRHTLAEGLHAQEELRARGQNLTFPFDPKKYTDVHDDAHRLGRPHCPVCGFPPGQKGYVRLDLSVGHPLFGEAFRCPACNPD